MNIVKQKKYTHNIVFLLSRFLKSCPNLVSTTHRQERSSSTYFLYSCQNNRKYNIGTSIMDLWCLGLFIGRDFTQTRLLFTYILQYMDDEDDWSMELIANGVNEWMCMAVSERMIEWLSKWVIVLGYATNESNMSNIEYNRISNHLKWSTLLYQNNNRQ